MVAQRTSEPWRVSVLFSKTGYMTGIEETQLRGTLLAIEEINASGAVNGREMSPVIYDPGSEATECQAADDRPCARLSVGSPIDSHTLMEVH